jgi:hypothetical protein
MPFKTHAYTVAFGTFSSAATSSVVRISSGSLSEVVFVAAIDRQIVLELLPVLGGVEVSLKVINRGPDHE